MKRSCVFGQLRLKREAPVCECGVELDVYLVLPRAPPEDVRPVGAAAQVFVRIRMRRTEPAAGEEQHTSASDAQLFELERQLNLHLPIEYARVADARCSSPRVLQQREALRRASRRVRRPSLGAASADSGDRSRLRGLALPVRRASGAHCDRRRRDISAVARYRTRFAGTSKCSAARLSSLLPDLKPVRTHAYVKIYSTYCMYPYCNFTSTVRVEFDIKMYE